MLPCESITRQGSLDPGARKRPFPVHRASRSRGGDNEMIGRLFSLSISSPIVRRDKSRRPSGPGTTDKDNGEGGIVTTWSRQILEEACNQSSKFLCATVALGGEFSVSQRNVST
jgi:hypothetical protein